MSLRPPHRAAAALLVLLVAGVAGFELWSTTVQRPAHVAARSAEVGELARNPALSDPTGRPPRVAAEGRGQVLDLVPCPAHRSPTAELAIACALRTSVESGSAVSTAIGWRAPPRAA